MTDQRPAPVANPWPEARGYNPHDQELIVTLWDDARTSRLSELYYSRRITVLTRVNFAIELVIAMTASGSGISGLEVVRNGLAASLWPCLAALTALLAIAKPLMSIDRKLRHATRQQQTYRRLLGTFENLAFDVRQAGRLTAKHRQRFQRAREILRQAEEQDDGEISPSVLRPLEERVKKEMPADQFWVSDISLAGSTA